MIELILEAQKALDNDDMKVYECVQAKIREKYLKEEAKLSNFTNYHACCNKLKNKKV